MAVKLLSSSNGSVTLDVPVTASNYNVTLPAANGIAMITGNIPVFSAYASATFSVPSSTYTKIPIDTKIFDTNNNFDTTNKRFTPTVAGYYQVQGACFISPPNNTSGFILTLYKNGSEYQQLMRDQYEVNFNQMPSGGTLVYLNGSTDYIELYMWQNGGSTQTFGQANQQTTYFNGYLVRAA